MGDQEPITRLAPRRRKGAAPCSSTHTRAARFRLLAAGLSIAALALLSLRGGSPQESPLVQPADTHAAPTPIVEPPPPRPTLHALRPLLRSERRDWRARGLAQARRAPSEETLLLLLDHIRSESDASLRCQAILDAKRTGVKLGTRQAARHLAALFSERSRGPELRQAVLMAFEAYPQAGDPTVLQPMRLRATPREDKKIQALLARRNG